MTDLVPADESAPAPDRTALTGRAPARTPRELAELMDQLRLGTAVLEHTAAWLSSERRSSPRTQCEYSTDLSWWLAYVTVRRLDPADVSPREADLYSAALREAGLAKTTRARRLSAVASWYAYLTRYGVTRRDPFEGMERPRVPNESNTRGLSEDELERMLAYSQVNETPRTYALLALMVTTGCRVSSVTSATIGAIGSDLGHTVIDLRVKGDKTKRLVLPPLAVAAIERYLAERSDCDDPDAPLFATNPRGSNSGGKPVDQPYVFRTVRRVARKAGIPHADAISPHSLRHSVATLLFDRGNALQDVQDQLGHADPRTTRRYDRHRGSLDRSPAYDLGNTLAAGIDRHRRTFEEGGRGGEHPQPEEGTATSMPDPNEGEPGE